MKGALIDDLKIQNLRGERTINDAAKYNSKEKQARHLMKVYAPVYSKHYLASNNRSPNEMLPCSPCLKSRFVMFPCVTIIGVISLFA